MKASITNVCFLVVASLFGPAVMVRGANVAAAGYINVTFGQHPQLIANQLSDKANRIDQVLEWAPEGTKLVTFDGRNWLTNEYLQGAWTFPEITLSPGGGALLFSPTNWQINGEDIPNATEPTLAIPQAGLEHFGKYWLKIWDLKSWVWSDIAAVQAASSLAPRLTIEQDSQRRGMLLRSQGTSGRKAAIEVSTDLIQWIELGGTEPINPDAVLDRWSSQAARFYRLRLD
jgi:hypothetical protein